MVSRKVFPHLHHASALLGMCLGLLVGCGGHDYSTPAAQTPWTKQLGVAPGYTEAAGIILDSGGNLYVTGSTTGGLAGNALTGLQDAFLAKYDSAGALAWVRQFGSAGQTADGNSVAIGSDGSIYVAGITSGGLAGNTPVGGNGMEDAFLAQFGSDGTQRWTRQFGVVGTNTTASAVATDSTGYAYVSGTATGQLAGAAMGSGSANGFVTRFDALGNQGWVQEFGVGTSLTFGFFGAGDGNGHIYVTGWTAGGSGVTGTADVYLAQVNTGDGSLGWTEHLGAAGAFSTGSGVAADGQGHVYVTGYTAGGLDGNTPTGTNDIFVTQYASDGTRNWTRQFGSAGASSEGIAVTVNPAGQAYVTGNATGALAGNTQTGSLDCFVASFASDGTSAWIRQFGVTGLATAGTSAAMDGAGNSYFGGSTSGGLDGNTPVGTDDAFIVKYSGAGVRQ